MLDAYDDKAVVSLNGFAAQSVPLWRWQPSGFGFGGYYAKNVLKIVILGREGNDSFTNRTPVPSAFLSGLGDDTATGGTGDDELHGEWGNDILYGDSGNDIVAGQDGADWFFGQGGDD